MKVRLCFLIRQLNEGGAQRQLIELIKNLDQDRFDVSIITFYRGGRFEAEANNIPGVTVYCLDKAGRWDVPFFLIRLLKTLRGIRPNILHGYLSTANLLALVLRPFSPGYHAVWGVRSSNMDASHYDWLTRLHYAMEKMLAGFADLIIINSFAARTYHIDRGFPDSKCIVIPNGIDVTKFQRSAEAGGRFRHSIGVDANESLIGIVARLDPMKGHTTFLRAAALLRASRDNVRFVCVGGGSQRYGAHLRALASSLGLDSCITWTGTRANMVDVYSSLDLLCLSSSYGEGFPNVVAEAMACGVPCAVTDVGDAALVVGDTGEVVPPDDPPALVDAWNRILDQTADLELRRQKARTRIEQEFSVTALASHTSATLAELVRP